MSVLVVTRHAGTVEWLRQQGVVGEVVSHVTPEQVSGRDVVGILPVNLAALANSVAMVVFDNLPPEARGKELTPEEMDEYGASLRKYRVEEL